MADGGVHESLQLQNRFAALTASDSSPTFAIKSLFRPIIAVASLLATLELWGQPFYGPYLLLGVLAFFAAADFLKVSERQPVYAKSLQLRALLQLSLRW